MRTLRHLILSLRKKERPVRFVLGRILILMGVSSRLTIRRGGVSFRFHPSAMSLTYFSNPRSREQDEIVLQQLLYPGASYVDVGANVGSLALPAARHVGLSGVVIAIEPHPRIFQYLRANVSLNSLEDRVDCVLAGVGSRWDVVGMTDATQDDTNRISNQGLFRIPICPLDQIVALESVDLLKIDVEGAEIDVLQGARRVLGRTRAVYFEYSEENYSVFGHQPADAIRILETQGFLVHYLREGRWDLVGPDTRLPLMCNLLALSSEHLTKLRSKLPMH